MIFPGYDGGGEWGGAAVDPKGVMYVNSNEMAWIQVMKPVENTSGLPMGEKLIKPIAKVAMNRIWKGMWKVDTLL